MLNKVRDQIKELTGANRKSDIWLKDFAHISRELLHKDLLAQQRYQEPLRLTRHGFKGFSQNGEDGIIAEIIRRIGAGSKTFVEIGVETGVECNTALLLLDGWRGTWIEGSPEMAEEARKISAVAPVSVVNSFVTAENVDHLVSTAAGEDELTLLSIDIDSNDYWIWKAVTSVNPRMVIMEYNANIPPPISATIAYNDRAQWDGTVYFGASLSALEKLGREKGYSLVGCGIEGINAFFVRDDLLGDKFLAPYTAENHFEPPRYWVGPPVGHMPGFGKWENV